MFHRPETVPPLIPCSKKELKVSACIMFEQILWMMFLMALAAIVGVLLFRDKPNIIWFIIFAELALIIRFVFIFVMFSKNTQTPLL